MDENDLPFPYKRRKLTGNVPVGGRGRDYHDDVRPAHRPSQVGGREIDLAESLQDTLDVDSALLVYHRHRFLEDVVQSDWIAEHTQVSRGRLTAIAAADYRPGLLFRLRRVVSHAFLRIVQMSYSLG